MAEMTDREVSERLGRYRTKRTIRTTAIIVAVVLLSAAAVVVGVRWSAARDAARAEKARVESILQKPLLEWSEAERNEFPAEYENRRQAERATNPALWTAAEKKAEWWRYAKLVVKNKFARAK